jgi:Asp-tRNA(Asn)/Glu-tRNA(Gln) amidotransferase A subunit family amidase
VSAVELAAAAISWIEALNPILNCVVIERFEQAREDADRVDGGEGAEGVFSGVPVLLRDLGQQTRASCRSTLGRAALLRWLPRRRSAK